MTTQAAGDACREAFEKHFNGLQSEVNYPWDGPIGEDWRAAYAAGLAKGREEAKPKLVERGTADTVRRPIYIPDDSWAESLEQYQLQEDELMDDELPTADQRYLMIHQYAMAHRDLKTYRSQGGHE